MNNIEDVVKLICPNNPPDNWRENPDFAVYISRLGSLTVEQLGKEPNHISDEKTSILQQTQELAFANYKTFIQTSECSREVFHQFNNTEQRLEALITKLPEFSKKCEEFSKTSSDINTHRRLNSLTLTRNAQLLEILELPQLMDTCIQNGNYEEALELAAYVRRLAKKHGQIPIIASIVSDVEQGWLSMLHILISQLRTDVQLPKCLQVVGYLRRMEIFSEAELRLKFLQARDTWLRNLLAGIPKDDASFHLGKTIELSRIHLFNIVTQYRAIFSDDDAVLLSPKDQNINEGAVFYSWIFQKIAQFIKTLEQDLDRGIGTSIDSVIGQCMYFGLSFSRVGADFRSLLAPIFVRTIIQNFELAIRRTTKKYLQDMEHFSLPKMQPSVRSKPTTSDVDGPPQRLLEFYPLANYCNGILSAFNELRLCAPLAGASVVTDQLEESLSSVVKCTLTFYRREQQALTGSEKESMTRLCTAIAEDLIPHIQQCLHFIFNPAKLSAHLGISVSRIESEGLIYLDQRSILDPIAHLSSSVSLPVPVVLPEFVKSEL